MKPESKKSLKYERLYKQAYKLLTNSPSFNSKLATINAILYHKIPYVFWVGFYLLTDNNNRLIVGPYQGPLACQELEYPKGVCWHAILHGETVIVPDVSSFPDHISCDSRSKSEIVIPIRNEQNQIIGVLDVDSDKPQSFDIEDQHGLERILSAISPHK